MTEKNIFAYKLFLSLNISYFNFFFLWENRNPPPPEKSYLTLSLQPLSKSWGPGKLPFLKIWLKAQPPSGRNLVRGSTSSLPPTCRKGGGEYALCTCHSKTIFVSHKLHVHTTQYCSINRINSTPFKKVKQSDFGMSLQSLNNSKRKQKILSAPILTFHNF